MAKQQFQSNPKVNELFNDLEAYKSFCVGYGYKFDEATLYDMKNYAYQQFSKFNTHKNFKDQWVDDAKKFENQVIFQ